MKRKMISRALLAFACSVVLLAGTLVGCGGSGAAGSDGEHEAITIMAPFRNVSAFKDMVAEKYPEINLEIIPYSGKNYTAYAQASLKADDMSDIYFATVYEPSYEHVGDKLIDLSGYDFTDKYTEARLQDVTDNGAIYMLPTCYSCLGITYNKTLLKEHGWELPTNLKELEELASKAKEAGVNLCLTQIQYPGFGFQYWCNILDTSFFNTPDGVQWRADFLDGKATVAGSEELKTAMEDLDKWRDLGMLNDGGDPVSDDVTREEFAKGNTLFMLGNNNDFSDGDTTDEFGLMPYLSKDGRDNAFILQTTSYVGLNKHLQDSGNEQKLEDALHVMEVFSTVEGMQAFNSSYSDSTLLPLKDYTPKADGYYAEILDQLNEGLTAPFIYSGWEDLIVPIGNAGLDYIKGKTSLADFETAIDDSQSLIVDNKSQVFTTVTKKLDTDACAKLVGICFAKATDSDLALISTNKYYPYSGTRDELNVDGVSGALFAGDVTDMEISSIVPTGWTDNIKTVTLAGKRVKDLMDSGYDRAGDGNVYPYVLAAPEGFKIDDNATYKVAVAGVTDEVAKEGSLEDSGVLGLDAMKEYLSKFETLSPADVAWND